MKNLLLLFFAALITCLFTACPEFDDTVTIRGTVTITRNGIPWNTENFSGYDGTNRAYEPPPPDDRPIISAVSKKHGYVGKIYVYYDIFTPDWELPLEFQVNMYNEGGFFGRNLDSDDIITSSDTEKEIVFSDNPILDFAAFNLSGKIALPANGSRMSLFFTDESYKQIYHGSNGFTV